MATEADSMNRYGQILREQGKAVHAKLQRLVDQIKPGSLALRAWDAQVRAGDVGRAAACTRWVWRKAKPFLWASRYSFFPQLLLGLALVHLVPSEIMVREWRFPLDPFGGPSEAAEFLRTLWQVEASVLALSIAVIIFAFQAVSSSESGVRLYEFAEDTHLFPVFYVGIAGLVVDGWVLLGFGNGAPGGGAGLTATVISGASFPLLAWLFAGTIGALDPEQLHRRRIERLRETVEQAVERQIF